MTTTRGTGNIPVGTEHESLSIGEEQQQPLLSVHEREQDGQLGNSALGSETPRSHPRREERVLQNPSLLMLGIVLSVILTLSAYAVAFYWGMPRMAEWVVNLSPMHLLSANLSDIHTNPHTNDSYFHMATRMKPPRAIRWWMGHDPVGTEPSERPPLRKIVAAIMYQDAKVANFTAYAEDFVVDSETGLWQMEANVLVMDVDGMCELCEAMFEKGDVVWQMQGTVDVELAENWILDDVPLNHQLSFRGMDGFRDVQLSAFDLYERKPEGGIGLSVETNVVSPSNVAISLAELRLGIFVEDVQLAEVAAANISIASGANTIKARGKLLPLRRQKDVEVANRFFSRYLNGHSSEVVVQGQQSDGELPAWLDDALSSLRMRLPVDGLEHIDPVRQIELGNITVLLDDQQPYQAAMNASLAAALKLPFDFPVAVLAVRPHLLMHEPLLDQQELGSPFAQLHVPWIPVTSREDKHSKLVFVEGTITNGVMEARDEDERGRFEAFLARTLLSSQALVGLNGTIDARVKTDIGELELTNISMMDVVRLDGMAPIFDSPPELISFDVQRSTPDELIMALDLNLVNPTALTTRIHGTIAFDLMFDDEKVGLLLIEDPSFTPGNVTTSCYVALNPKHTVGSGPAKSFMSLFASGKDSQVVLAGNAKHTTLPSMRPAMTLFHREMLIPGLEQEFLEQSVFHLWSKTVELTLTNPFGSANVAIIFSNATSFYYDEVVGWSLVDRRDPHHPVPPNLDEIQLPAGSTVTTPRIPVQYNSGSVGFDIIRKALGGSLAMNVTVDSIVKVGDSALLGFWYDKTNMSVAVRL